jgi:hypothetical protein
MISRRGFFGALAATLAAVLPSRPFRTVAFGDAEMFSGIGGINTATYSFWRNQGTNAFDTLDESTMRDIYTRCASGEVDTTPI